MAICIGTYTKAEAIKLKKYLKKNVSCNAVFKFRGRGKRRHNGIRYAGGLPLNLATHYAIYLEDAVELRQRRKARKCWEFEQRISQLPKIGEENK